MTQPRRTWILAGVLLTVLVTTATGLAQRPRGGGPEGRVLSGADVGFRVTGVDPRTQQPTGTWVVRVDGRWVEVSSTPGIRPAK